MNKICFTTWIVFCCALRATAFAPYKDAFNSHYGTTGTGLDSCLICHQGSNPNSGPPQSLRNPYGSSFESQPHASLAAIQTAFTTIEGFDSDGDGVNNITEINARTFPGDPSSLPSTPPAIAQQPQSQTIISGQAAALTVAAAGTAPFAYQWYLGQSGDTSQPIGGATAANYTTPALTAPASYWVRVTNAAGFVDSATANIDILAPPAITQPPQSQTIISGQAAALTVAATGTAPFAYQWYLGQSGDTSQPIGGATAANYTTPALTAASSYWVRVTNAAGFVDSAPANIGILSPPGIAQQPQSQTIISGQAAVLTVTASGTAPFAYQWYLGQSGDTSQPIGGATAANYTTPALTAAASYWVRVSNAAGFVDSTTASIGILSLPAITQPPQSQTIVSGQAATLTVAATGTAPFTYQWYSGQSGNTSQPIGGATAANYTTPALTAAASYWVRVSNAAGFVDSTTASIGILSLPAITQPPQSQTIVSGQAATLTVAATGTAPFTYQWYLGQTGDSSQPIGGATAANYTTPALTAAASYWVRVSNAAGFVDSTTASIGILSLPAITQPPQSQTIVSGQAATLTVAAIGTAPFTYQWYLGQTGDSSQPIGGATAANYTTPALTAAASYWVRVSNAAGFVDSATANISVVTLPPRLDFTRSGSNFIISWDSSVPGYVLQQATRLGFADSWTDVPIPPTVNGTLYSVTRAISVTPLEVTRTSGKVTLKWIGDNMLQKSDSILGPWTDVAGASSPYAIEATGLAAFYRLSTQGFYRLRGP